jgi:hypothetical protein
MTYIPFNQVEDWKRVIRFKAAEFSRRGPEFLGSTESSVFVIDESGLNLWIGIRSIRARRIFETLHSEMFSGFEPYFRTGDGMLWARFGYSLPSTFPMIIQKSAEPSFVRFV